MQLDVHWLANAPTKLHMSCKAKDTRRDVRAYLRKSSVFENQGRAGWFVLISALLPSGEVASGPVKPLHEGTGTFIRDGAGAAVVVDHRVPPKTGVAGVKLFEAGESVSVYAYKHEVDTPSPERRPSTCTRATDSPSSRCR